MCGTIPDGHWGDMRRVSSVQASSQRPAAAHPSAISAESHHPWKGIEPHGGHRVALRWLPTRTSMARSRSSASLRPGPTSSVGNVDLRGPLFRTENLIDAGASGEHLALFVQDARVGNSPSLGPFVRSHRPRRRSRRSGSHTDIRWSSVGAEPVVAAWESSQRRDQADSIKAQLRLIFRATLLRPELARWISVTGRLQVTDR